MTKNIRPRTKSLKKKEKERKLEPYFRSFDKDMKRFTNSQRFFFQLFFFFEIRGLDLGFFSEKSENMSIN